MDTSVARAVRAAKETNLDAECKRLLSERQILSRMLHEWVGGFEALTPQEIEKDCFEGEPRIGMDYVDRDAETIRKLGEEDKTMSEGMTTFDIRFEAWHPQDKESDEKSIVCVEVDVEAQSKFNPGYPLLKRGLYYAGRLLSMQGAGIVISSHYERVRKVVSIWVCAHPPKKYAGTVTSFEVGPRALTGAASFPRQDFDVIQVVMACLNDGNPGSSPGALGMLETLLASKTSAHAKLAQLHDKYDIMVTREMDERVNSMCNLSEGYMEEGIAEGMAKGMAEGLSKGLEQGLEQGRAEVRKDFLEAAASLVRDGVLLLQEASDRFGFSEQELLGAL